MQNFATKPFIETAEPSMTSQAQIRKDSSKLPRDKDQTGATTRGDMTTQRTGNVFKDYYLVDPMIYMLVFRRNLPAKQRHA